MEKDYTKFIWPGVVLQKKKKVPKGPVGDKKHLINPNDSGEKTTSTLSYSNPTHKFISSFKPQKQREA